MKEVAVTAVAVRPWLSQGDVFAKVPVLRAGVTDRPEAQLTDGPALLVTHSCSIDKKRGKRSRLEYLTFLPIHDATRLPPDRQSRLRSSAGKLRPYEVFYLGDVPEVGDGYVNLVEPYTLPAVVFQPELRQFSADETGEGVDDRITLTFHNTRVATLSEEALALLQYKWMVHWTRVLPEGVEDN